MLLLNSYSVYHEDQYQTSIIWAHLCHKSWPDCWSDHPHQLRHKDLWRSYFGWSDPQARICGCNRGTEKPSVLWPQNLHVLGLVHGFAFCKETDPHLFLWGFSAFSLLRLRQISFFFNENLNGECSTFVSIQKNKNLTERTHLFFKHWSLWRTDTNGSIRFYFHFMDPLVYCPCSDQGKNFFFNWSVNKCFVCIIFFFVFCFFKRNGYMKLVWTYTPFPPECRGRLGFWPR